VTTAPGPHGGACSPAGSASGFDPIRRLDGLARILRQVIDCVEDGGFVVVDVWVEPG